MRKSQTKISFVRIKQRTTISEREMQGKVNLKTIAKLLAREDVNTFRRISTMCEPMLKNQSLVPAIKAEINARYPELDRTEESILFAGCVYYAFKPVSMIDSSLERAPNGLRGEMMKVMKWKDAPLCNHYAGIAAAYFKVKRFRAQVEEVLQSFERYSIKSNQIELFS